MAPCYFWPVHTQLFITHGSCLWVTGSNHKPNPNCEFKGHSLSESTLSSHPRGGTEGCWSQLPAVTHWCLQGFVRRGGQDAAGMRRRSCASAWPPATRAFLLPGVTPASDSRCLPGLLLHRFMHHLWAFGSGKLNVLFIFSLYKMRGLAQAEVTLVSQRAKLGERGGGSTVVLYKQVIFPLVLQFQCYSSE